MIFKAEVRINKKDYLAINAYYLKKYIGIKELLLVLFLFVAGTVLGFMISNYFILTLCGVTIVLMLGAVIFYFLSANAGYNIEFSKRQATKWDITFSELGIVVETHEKNGEQQYTEKRLFADIEKIAVKKDRVYLYFGAALMYYIKYDALTEGNFAELCEFLKLNVDTRKFRMKAKKRDKLNTIKK